MAFNKSKLNMLSKADLIEIILSDRMWERKAFLKLNDMISKKVISIIEEQEKCDFSTRKGIAHYEELEKEYQKWSKIHEEL